MSLDFAIWCFCINVEELKLHLMKCMFTLMDIRVSRCLKGGDKTSHFTDCYESGLILFTKCICMFYCYLFVPISTA